MRTFILITVFAVLAMASGGAPTRGPAIGPGAASDVCSAAASRFLIRCQRAQAPHIRVEPHGDHVLLLRGAGLARTGELSFFVKGITAADIRERFNAPSTGAGTSIAALLLGFWSAGLVALARLGW